MSSAFAEWLTAIGTVGAVVVALFGEQFSRWRSRPELRVNLEKMEPWIENGNVKWNGGKYENKGFIVRLSIRNAGKSRAENVRLVYDRITWGEHDNNVLHCMNEKAVWSANGNPSEAVVEKYTEEFVNLVDIYDNLSIVTPATRMAFTFYPNLPGPIRNPEWKWHLSSHSHEAQEPVSGKTTVYFHVSAANAQVGHYALVIEDERSLHLSLYALKGDSISKRDKPSASLTLDPSWLSPPD